MLREDMGGLFLIQGDDFSLPAKLYGDVKERSKRILQTFEDRPFITGVLLEGEKGSGKTLLAKQISLEGIEAGIPTILVNSPFCGVAFNSFMQELHQPCIVLFDEFEKVYHDKENQQEMLTFLDGTIPTKKLCILTVNDSWHLDTNLVNRPGRLFYSLAYSALDKAFIREYATDRLNDKSHIEEVVRVATTFTQFNFDQLQALVEEMNRYNETPLKALRWLNINPSYTNNHTFLVLLRNPKGRVLKSRQETWSGNPLEVEGKDIYSSQGLDFSYFSTSKAAAARQENDVSFDRDDFVKAEQGVFTFQNSEGYVLTLTPKPAGKALGYDVG